MVTEEEKQEEKEEEKRRKEKREEIRGRHALDRVLLELGVDAIGVIRADSVLEILIANREDPRDYTKTRLENRTRREKR